MVAFSFRREFAPTILSGQKRQTIRATKRCSAGDAMQLFTGMRTKACVKIVEVRCVLTDYVHIDPGGITFGDKSKHPDADTFARWDGFDDLDDMRAWFRNAYETEHFIGYVHRWEPPAPASAGEG